MWRNNKKPGNQKCMNINKEKDTAFWLVMQKNIDASGIDVFRSLDDIDVRQSIDDLKNRRINKGR